MINLLLFLVFLACFGLTAAWVAGNPGSVVIHWLDYRIDTSFGFLVLLAIVAAVVLAYAWNFVRGVILAPGQFMNQRSIRHYDKGLNELTCSVAALASADIAGALAHTRKAEKFLGKTPLTMLLSAQIARSQGDDATTRGLLEQMLDHKETEYVAARSLSEAASKQHLFPKALALAERAQAANPKGIDSVISLHVRMGQWQDALSAIAVASRKSRISRVDRRRYRGIIFLQHGRQLLDDHHNEGALNAARHALKYLPDFVPAVVLAARAYAANGKQGKGVRLLLRAGKKSPHPLLAETLREITPGYTPEKRNALLNKLTGGQPEPMASGTAWECRLCHHAAPQWNTHCPSCGGFDTLDWRDVMHA